jgi:uncharacterized caspase-like protein
VAAKEGRVGVFVGVGKYKDPTTRPLPACPADARTAAAAMKERCGLDDAVVLTDEQATLANVEQALRALPAKTKPGDTVVLFWSGHGSRFPDLDLRKIVHCLITYDTATIDLPEKPTEAQIRQAIDTMRRTTMTSVRLQRLLQALDGRKIVIVADACHSGGLHLRGKGAKDPGLPDGADAEPILGDLMVRSKDINQRDVALLAGCKADEVSMSRREGDLGVLTYYLLEQVKAGDGPLTLDAAYQGLKPPLAAYIARTFPSVTQTPVLINDLVRPFSLRPGAVR